MSTQAAAVSATAGCCAFVRLLPCYERRVTSATVVLYFDVHFKPGSAAGIPHMMMMMTAFEINNIE